MALIKFSAEELTLSDKYISDSLPFDVLVRLSALDWNTALRRRYDEMSSLMNELDAVRRRTKTGWINDK